MTHFLKTFTTAVLLCLTAALSLQAQEEKSFSKQMNEVKRSGKYVYAEATAPNEADAKAACDALLKIELTKALASEADAKSSRIVKDLAAYHREYIMQPRQDMVRVFGYIAKEELTAGKSEKAASEAPQTPAREKNVAEATPEKAEKAETKAEKPAKASKSSKSSKKAEPEVPAEAAEPAHAAEPQPVVAAAGERELIVGDLDLNHWQLEMLKAVAAENTLMDAKKVLNRFKSQNKVKRLGDQNTSSTRLVDSYYLFFGADGAPEALLAPSVTSTHYNLFTGETVEIYQYNGDKHLWFQITK